MNAVELADLIAALLRGELPDAIVDEPQPEGPLFAKLILRGSAGHFAIVVEDLPRTRTTR